MRISTAYAQSAAIDGISDRQARTLELQEQLASTKRVNRPSDDPVAAAEAERLRSRQARIATEQRAAGYARQVLSAADGALGDADAALQSARESLLSAGNATASAGDRRTYAEQLRQVREQLLSIANRRDGAGGFVFGGQGTRTAPIPTSGATYLPQAGTQRVGQELPATTSLDGRENFVAIPTSTGPMNIFAQLDAAIAVLENPAAAPAAVGAAATAGIGAIDVALERFSTTRTTVGERLKALDAHEQALENGSIDSSARLSQLVDLDMARGISEMVQSQTALEAAMKSYAQVARLTLFDYL
ncbi:MAG TPA: flagellar hook-associated protein FlgL [Burkholderiaceae bacterium]|nr:flagellar hook-associated protein FlgL [Burkholderiaceae bacterium]